MDKTTGSLTVFFEDPFWVAVYQESSHGELRAARMVLGAEPKDYELYPFFLKNWDRLWRRLRLGPALAAGVQAPARPNPKRMQREVRRALAQQGPGTKAQQALQLQREEQAAQRQRAARENREAQAQRRFTLRQEKKRQKHRGR